MEKSDWQKLYEALANRTEMLERENAWLKTQLLVAGAQSKTWENDKEQQQTIIQRELTRLNTMHQEQAEEIVRLKTELRKYHDAD